MHSEPVPQVHRVGHRHQLTGDIECTTSLPQLLSPDEAAHYLGVSAYTVRHRLKTGELPGRKHGARWLIRVVDLAHYVEPNNV